MADSPTTQPTETRPCGAAQGDYPGLPVKIMLALHPELSTCVDDLVAAYQTIAASEAYGGCLYLCGNGGSMADALHISGEMIKSYTLPRPLDDRTRIKIAEAGPDGQKLSLALERGLRAMVLGLNHILSSALENDVEMPAINYAQELLVMARPGDVLLGISTSGNARNVCYAAQVARALQVTVVSLTGQSGGKLATLSDVAIRAPAIQTDRVQEHHVHLYHCLCEMLEIHFFGAAP
jgi:D-sedoheptulose 7-phosphate isomerase